MHLSVFIIVYVYIPQFWFRGPNDLVLNIHSSDTIFLGTKVQKYKSNFTLNHISPSPPRLLNGGINTVDRPCWQEPVFHTFNFNIVITFTSMLPFGHPSSTCRAQVAPGGVQATRSSQGHRGDLTDVLPFHSCRLDGSEHSSHLIHKHHNHNSSCYSIFCSVYCP